MLGFFRRYRLQFYILAFLVFGVNSFLNFYDYFTLEYTSETNKGMDLFIAIVAAMLAIFYLISIIRYMKEGKSRREKVL